MRSNLEFARKDGRQGSDAQEASHERTRNRVDDAGHRGARGRMSLRPRRESGSIADRNLVAPRRSESTLAFDDARRITGHTACNRYFGELEVGEDTLRLKPAGTTRMACAPVVMDQESRFLAALSAATAFRIDGGKLLLLDEAGRVRVRLVPHGPRREGSSPTPGQPASSSLPLAAHAFDRDNRSSFALVHIENAARWAKQST